ncbi:protein obstructor-E-like [Pollicipes pollicipes]|uniref:protein obstructor-E-like n=1 Tax=Pollicipes pollicipes TaxID=41117 RepID=UPI00188569A7|nr:protein obstructor-E-like [Pollicipes pollicipes]XP_037083464.1 protein obstructor-E-like [Pollicipes pollicipes]
MWCALLPLVLAGAAAVDVFECPLEESTGKFIDPDECDTYWDCFRGEAVKKECKDGWAFDPNRVQLAEPCDYIFNVDCYGRESLGEPLGTGVCERQNGIYAHEDPEVCDKYYSCSDDTPTQLICSPGLHYNISSRTCDWPQSANRGSCGQRTSLDGFTCDPSIDYFTPSNQKIAHPTFAHPEDCTKFYVCKNGIEPALSGCDEGLVYSEEISACDDPVNVPECADWFDTAPETRRRK